MGAEPYASFRQGGTTPHRLIARTASSTFDRVCVQIQWRPAADAHNVGGANGERLNSKRAQGANGPVSHTCVGIEPRIGRKRALVQECRGISVRWYAAGVTKFETNEKCSAVFVDTAIRERILRAVNCGPRPSGAASHHIAQPSLGLDPCCPSIASRETLQVKIGVKYSYRENVA